MPVQIFAPGPVEIYVRFRGDPTVYYFGTCVDAPEVEATPFFVPIFTDAGGRSLPDNLVYDREVHAVAVTLGRYSGAVARRMQNFALDRTTGLGSNLAQAVGQLVIGVSDIVLYLVNAYFPGMVIFDGKVPDGMSMGRRYDSAVVAGYKESTTRNRTKELSVSFLCYPHYRRPASPGFPDNWTFYTEDASAFVGLTPE